MVAPEDNQAAAQLLGFTKIKPDGKMWWRKNDDRSNGYDVLPDMTKSRFTNELICLLYTFGELTFTVSEQNVDLIVSLDDETIVGTGSTSSEAVVAAAAEIFRKKI